MLAVPIDAFHIDHILETEPAMSILLDNYVGDVAADSQQLLAGGTADERGVIDRVRDLLDNLCDAGQVTEYLEIEGATHDNEYALAADRIEAWLALLTEVLP